MPNLNLKGDAPDEINELPEGPDSEQSGSGSGGSFKRTLPLIAGGAIALVLAFYILNKIGIVHLWGPKKAASTMMIIEQADTTSQVLSDSAMTEQFKKDSLEAVAAVRPSGSAKDAGLKHDEASRSASVKEKKAAALEAKKQADAAKAASIEAAKKQEAKKAAAAAEARKAEREKAAAAEAAKKAEAKKAASAEQKNMTTVEVPGAPRRHQPSAAIDEGQQPRPAADAKPAAREPRIAAHTAVQQEARKARPAKKTNIAEPSVARKEILPSSPTAAKTKEGGSYTVQISSWTSASKARAFASRFTQAGVPAFIVTEGRIHRVCTGHFATQEAATARAEELVPMLETKYDIIMLK
jgi:hypothetical protein